MNDDQQFKDIETLARNLHDLLCGELKVGPGLLNIGKALKREGRNKEWVKLGLKRWVESNEEAIIILAAALGEGGLEKAKAWLDNERNQTT